MSIGFTGPATIAEVTETETEAVQAPASGGKQNLSQQQQQLLALQQQQVPPLNPF